MSNPIAIKEQLAELLNEFLATQSITATYTAADLTFGEPELYDEDTLVLTDPTARNTRVAITAVGEDGVEVEYVLHYNRLSLALLVSTLGSAITGDGDDSTTHDVLAAINTRLKLNLTEADLVDELLEPVDPTHDTVVLTAAPASLTVIGEAELTLTKPAANPA